MRWMFFAACAALAAAFCLPGEAARPAAAAPAAASEAAAETAGKGGAGDAITFEQYRDWRNAFAERRRGEIDRQLAAADFSPERKARLERAKAYYERLAGLPASERDKLYRGRFERIDANHDGIIDPAERAAWRDKQRSFYRRGAGQHAAGDPAR